MTIEIKIPEVGESITEVYVGEWHKAEGDQVAEDEDLVEIESDKATFDVPASSGGTLTEILKKSGETASVGETIAYLEPGDDGGDAAAGSDATTRDASESDEPVAQQDPQPSKSRDKSVSQSDSNRKGKRQHVTRPAPVRRKSDSTDGSPVSEANRDKGDTDESPRPTTSGDLEEEVIPMTAIRRQIAERLVKAQQTAALLTTFNEIDMSAVISLRETMQEQFRDEYDVKLGFMSFFVKAAVDALGRFPQLNAEVRDDDIVYRNYFDIGIAIGASRGLVVPVVRDAQCLSFAEIEQMIHDFAERAENGELSPDELRGGTFTISNGGVYGSLLSTPIINPPQSGVLGMHAIQERPVTVDGDIVSRPMMYVALTYDHRIVDGREAVSFLRRIKEAIEQPARMLVEV